ncbi:hypothetical protein [Paenibacillus sp. FSL K6-2524]|uniref:hypothetical protein n=1 Tax=Paenibacillus sp. FSL K6-2524 TaxID=2954516 RepID=UPI0030F84F39
MINERRLFISAFFSIIFSFILMYFIGIFINQDIPSSLFPDIKLMFSVDSNSFLPEPGERNIFVISVFFIPITMSILYIFLNRILIRIPSLSSKLVYNVTYSLSIVIVLVLLILYSLQGDNIFFLDNFFVKEYPLFFIVIILSIGVVGYLFGKLDYKAHTYIKLSDEKSRIIKNSLVLLFILFIGLSNVYSVYSLADTPEYLSHLNAIFHSMAAVYMGESMLVDITNQYGLYPHILEMVFRLIGLNVFTFT